MSISKPKINIWTATILNLNSMIGAGIFSATMFLGDQVGAAGMITFLLAFFAVWFIAQSFARAAYLYPQEGSFYTYASRWGGHTLGLMSAGMYLVGLLIAMGLLCKLCGIYLHNFFPSLSITTLSLLTLGFLVLFNLCGMVLTKAAQYVLLAFTIFPLLGTIALCASKINLANLTPFMPYGISSITSGIQMAIFGLFGFECVVSLFGLVEHPEYNVPRALRYSLILTGLIYFAFIACVLLSVPHEIFQTKTTIAQALMYLFPDYSFLLNFVNATIIIAFVGTVHSVIWGSSELMLAYVKNLRSSCIKQAVAKNMVTKNSAVLVCGLIMLVSCLLIDNMNIFFSITNVCLLFAYATAIAALLFEKNEWKSGQNIQTLLGLTTALVILAFAVQTLVKYIL